MKPRHRLNVLAAAVLSFVAAVGVDTATAAGNSSTNAQVASDTSPVVAHAFVLHKGDAYSGQLSFAQPMHVEVALKLRNGTELKSFIAAAHQGLAPLAQRVMPHAQFMQRHAPTASQAQAVADYLTRSGFSNVVISPNNMLVSADATADVVQSAFHTTFSRVHAKDGRDTYANTSDVHIPGALQDSVLSVIGLQDVHRAHTFARVLPQGGLSTQAITGHNPTEFSSIYGGTGVPTAAGVTVGIITQGSLTQVVKDLNTFTSNNGLATVTTQTVNTNGTSTDTSGLGEWDLDSQDIVGMGGGQVGKLIFYNIPTLSNANLTADINTVVNANAAKIINVSLGECETDAQGDGSAAAQDQSFQQAAAQGQTFSISTGDSGADECGNGGTTPSWPAASQYVVAVAGTKLDASTTTWNSEVVWNDLSINNGATGGSESTFEPKPSWQTLWSGTHRGVADVAFDGSPSSGAEVIVNGSTEQIGGTSLSAPIFAGMWARVIAVKGTAVGFAGPLLYQLPASDFHDVTSGNNGGETAGAGYDLASGRGSVILSSAINDLGGGGGTNTPPVANFSFVASGLTVNFTDSSTDSDGTIASRSWTFGDGGTSTATNPSHTYAAAGTYSVSLTVTDNGGATNTKTQSVTVSSGGGSSQLLGNTGFESGSASPWSMSSGTLCSNSTCSGETAHAGSWFAWMDGYGSSHTDTVSQTVTIPAGKTSASLRYYLHIDTSETTTSTAYDKLYVRVYSTSGTLLKTLATYSNLNHNSGYTVHSNSLASYIGQTVVIKFTGTEDSSLQTSFVLDDVTLTVQ
ncbi:MAG: protease pro-enzyme activation domain-containing protein [Mizugakiibacter sp.]|uniref:protease pro-enzyme activation domain-containing protein n=1 Tax=Mizugakiibacter sp. TaxID=1972610 RepID=UPI0031C43AE4|nr:PKD domain-containing protein [Xanthomonadaceae bacterium]